MEVRNVSRTSVSFDINSSNWGNHHMFPEAVYIDTNSAINIAEQKSAGKLAEDYINELIQRDGFIIWSHHTIDELSGVLHVNHYKRIAKSKNIKGDHRYAAHKIAENTATDQESIAAAQTVTGELERIVNYLEQFGMQVDAEETHVNELTNHIYTSYGNSKKDAKHIAIANINGVNNFLTQDGGFLRFPHINVFGSSQEISQTYNASQLPAPFIDLSKFLSSGKGNDSEGNVS